MILENLNQLENCQNWPFLVALEPSSIYYPYTYFFFLYTCYTRTRAGRLWYERILYFFRFKLLSNASARGQDDGLNSMNFRLLSLEERELYTLVYIKVNETEVLQVRFYNIKTLYLLVSCRLIDLLNDDTFMANEYILIMIFYNQLNYIHPIYWDTFCPNHF